MEEKLFEILEQEIQKLSSIDNDLRETMIAAQEDEENIQDEVIAGLLRDRKQLEEAIESEKSDYIRAEYNSDLERVNQAIDDWEQTQLHNILTNEQEIENKRNEEAILEEYKREKSQNDEYNQNIDERKAELEHRKSEAETALNTLSNYSGQTTERNEIESDIEKITAELERINNEKEMENNRFAVIEARYNDLCDKYNVKGIIEKEEAKHQVEKQATQETKKVESKAPETENKVVIDDIDKGLNEQAQQESKKDIIRRKREAREKAIELLPKVLEFALEKLQNGEEYIDFEGMKEKLQIDENVVGFIKNMLMTRHIIDKEGLIYLPEQGIRDILGSFEKKASENRAKKATQILQEEIEKDGDLESSISKYNEPDKDDINVSKEKIENEAIKNFEEYVKKETPNSYGFNEAPSDIGSKSSVEKVDRTIKKENVNASSPIESATNNNKYKITIGSQVKIKRNGMTYIVKPLDYKQGALLNSLYRSNKFEDVEKNLKDNFSTEIIDIIEDCHKNKVQIDFTILNSIKSVGIPAAEKDELIKGYLSNMLNLYYIDRKNQDSATVTIHSLEKYKDAKINDNMNIKYDLKDLSKPISIFKLIFSLNPEKEHLTIKEKETISQLAYIANEYGIAKKIGEFKYKTSIVTRVLGKLKKNKNLLPAPEHVEASSYDMDSTENPEHVEAPSNDMDSIEKGELKGRRSEVYREKLHVEFKNNENPEAFQVAGDLGKTTKEEKSDAFHEPGDL